MEGEFERKIAEQLHAFKLNPNEMVWKEVEAALHKKERKVLPFWWMVAVLVLLCSVCGSIFYNYKSIGLEKGNKDLSISTKEKSKLELKNLEIITQNKKDITTEIDSLSANQTSLFTSIDPILKKQIKAFKKDNFLIELRKKSDAGNVIFTLITKKADTEKNNKIVLNEDEHFKSSSQNLQMTTPIATARQFKEEIIQESLLKLDSTYNKVDSNKLNSSNAKTTTDKKIINVIANSSSTIQLNKPKKHKWYVVAGGGITTVRQNILGIGSEEKAIPNAFSTAFLTNSNNNIATDRTPQTNNGINFSIGIKRETTINKRWSYLIGVQYQYLQNRYTLSNDTAILNTTLTDRYINFYNNGTTVNITNYANWLQIPVSISYTINPTAKNKFAWQSGGSLAIAFAKNWLLLDKSSNTYNSNKSQNNTFLLNLETGFTYQRNNNFKVGLLVQQGITPIHTQPNTKLYFTQYSLNLSYPITQKNKK